MDLNTLTAISPIDGRYRNQSASLSSYFSEYGLIKFRVLVEVEYFLALRELGIAELQGFPAERIGTLRKFAENFDLEQAQRIKDIEATTNHDVKAVEYFLKDYFDEIGIGQFKEFIHFGLTSQDINNTAVPISLKLGMDQEIIPRLEKLGELLSELAKSGEKIPMLARTHGQPASPSFRPTSRTSRKRPAGRSRVARTYCP